VEGYGNKPEKYLPIFKKFGVTHVIRLNKASYVTAPFIASGIRVTDLTYPDGSIPPQAIVDRFFSICEEERGVIAIHCKAGLGRTGTLIGLWAMREYQFPASSFIGWIRVARPGSVLGPQQHYLIQKEDQMFNWTPYSEQFQSPKCISKTAYERTEDKKLRASLEMSASDRRKIDFGDKNQGEYLMSAKKRN
jgi:cell division cycle 14